MTIQYVMGTLIQIEDLHQKARTHYLVAYKAAYPNSICRIQKDYKDRITGVVSDVVIQLSTDGKDHSDRLDNPMKHPDPAIDKVLLAYDDKKKDKPLETAFYYNSTAIATLGINSAITHITRVEAENEGFFSDNR